LCVCLFAAFASLLIFSRSSFLYPFNTWVDSNASLTVGNALMHGRVLYVDIFDQRGPYLYFFYGLASLVSPTTFTGVFLLECLSFTLFLYYAYRIATLYVHKNALLVIPILAIIIPSSKAFGLGGSPEELLLPVFAYGLYSLLAYIRTPEAERPSTVSLLTNGFLCGIILWTKFSLLGFYLAFGVALTVALIARMQAKHLLPAYGLLLGGLLLATIPWVIYFGVHRAIGDWLQGYFVTNLTNYMVVPGSILKRVLSLAVNVRNTLARNLQYSSFLIVGLVWVLFGKKSQISALEKLSIWLFAVLTAFFVYVGGRDFYYYGIALCVYSVFGIILVLRLVERYFDKTAVVRTIFGIGLAGMAVVLLLYGLTTSRNTPFLSTTADEYVLFRFRDEMKKSESPTLFNYGYLDLGLFNICDIMPTTKYFCKLNLVSKEMTQQIDGYLNDGLVEYVVTYNDDLATVFPLYELIDSGYSVINEGRFEVYLYRLISANPLN
jgi:hypothetical protein